ncbi:MAG: hypothetical protein HQL33_08280 [Alphaproteobacteria bacterium]|nr:hypothetical protein [Alphaproteobacteria bacterium]MBF0129977.1 hypothetical protein [Alphaproteobacteria bacterium]
MKKRKGFNPKRRIVAGGALAPDRLDWLLVQVTYTGNPEHKKYPGDYGLSPPANPRPGKTLCDARGALSKSDAEALLKSGIGKGMVSVQERSGWPQNVWAVSDTGVVFEAQLENREEGRYHGYPMPEDDDFRSEVIREWGGR